MILQDVTIRWWSSLVCHDYYNYTCSWYCTLHAWTHKTLALLPTLIFKTKAFWPFALLVKECIYQTHILIMKGFFYWKCNFFSTYHHALHIEMSTPVWSTIWWYPTFHMNGRIRFILLLWRNSLSRIKVPYLI